jgi:hypothetical protein
MTGVPPLATPITQLRPTYVAAVIVGTLCKLSGASGFVKMIAPLPYEDCSDEPIMLDAVTLAYTGEPQAM